MSRDESSGDLVITNIGQLLTFAGPDEPRVGAAMGELGLVLDAAVLVESEFIEAIGPEREVLAGARGAETLDARGRVVMPGFVDAHTHTAFAGSRESELADKLEGKSYSQIAREGGGIQKTVRDTRAASEDQLMSETCSRLRRMLSLGTTTVEIKSGYGLDLDNELKLLRVIVGAEQALPVTVVPTFLGAHAVPVEHWEDPAGYVDELVDTILPAVASHGMARFCDVFVEDGFFSEEQGRTILGAGKALGLAPKVHADEITSCGGAELAGEMEAVSADHLLHSTTRGLKAMKTHGTLAVVLPGTSFSTAGLPYCDARRIIELNLPVALGTDLSPNSWIESMQFVVSLACYHLRMRPEEALCAATINAAWAIGLADQVGSLEVGKRADMLLMDVKDYREIPYRIGSNLVSSVVKNGVVVGRG